MRAAAADPRAMFERVGHGDAGLAREQALLEIRETVFLSCQAGLPPAHLDPARLPKPSPHNRWPSLCWRVGVRRDLNMGRHAVARFLPRKDSRRRSAPLWRTRTRVTEGAVRRRAHHGGISATWLFPREKVGPRDVVPSSAALLGDVWNIYSPCRNLRIWDKIIPVIVFLFQWGCFL